MAKTLQESPISTPNARSGLLVGVHWRRVDSEVHLGYRKGVRAGVWLVRWRVGTGYRQAPLGPADDTLKEGCLSFSRAEAAARSHVESARQEALALADGPPVTVREAVENYIAGRDARDSKRAGRSVRSDAGQRLRRYVLGEASRGEKIPPAAMAAVALYALTEEDLRGWLDGLPHSLKSTSRQRMVNDVKAALNAAYEANRKKLPASVAETIRHGLELSSGDAEEEVARDNQILADAEVGRLIRAAHQVDVEQEWGGDFYRLVVVLASTGMRFSQVTRMRVRDVQTANRRLMVPVSRKGRGGKSGHIVVPVWTDVIEALAPAIVGRDGMDVLLMRWRHKQVPGSIRWEKDQRGAWQSSSEFHRAWQAVRKIAKLDEVVVYCFRHSSIVRGIRANLPIRLVAAMHDTSVAMVEKHYARWIVDGLEDLAAKAVVPLIPDEGGNVVTLATAIGR